MDYLFNLLVALDQFINTLIGGMPDETLSARAYRADVHGALLGRAFRPLIDMLFHPFERGHCHQAYLSELGRTQLPKKYQVQEGP